MHIQGRLAELDINPLMVLASREVNVGQNSEAHSAKSSARSGGLRSAHPRYACCFCLGQREVRHPLGDKQIVTDCNRFYAGGIKFIAHPQRPNPFHNHYVLVLGMGVWQDDKTSIIANADYEGLTCKVHIPLDCFYPSLGWDVLKRNNVVTRRLLPSSITKRDDQR
jgi:hypothetical protein